jgi:carbonic anhydrase
VIRDQEKKAERLVELNVIEQVFNLTKTSIIQNAWSKGKKLSVHGLVYDLRTGFLNDLNTTITDKSELPKFYQIDAFDQDTKEQPRPEQKPKVNNSVLSSFNV